MTNIHEILEKVRGSRQRLPVNEASVLFAASVRLAASQGATLRARLLSIDDAGGLHVAPLDDRDPETEPGYLAPELLGPDAPRKNEPRVQVYAAGALGYELLTGHVAPGNPAELSGPLGDIVKIALAPDRRERFGDLTQLQDAIEGVQPRPPAEGERNIFSALRNRWSRAPPEKEALARVIEKLSHLESQVAQLAKAQGRLDAAQREALERIDRFEDGLQRLPRAKKPSAAVPVLLGVLLAVAGLVAAGLALGIVPQQLLRGSRQEPPPPQPIASTPPPSAAPAMPLIPDASVAEEKPAAIAAADAGAPEAAVTAGKPAEAPPDAGAVAQAALPDAGAPARAEPPKRQQRAELSQQAMLHAVAISQVRRGESALEQNQPEEALASFRAALENEASLPAAFRGMGMAYAMQGNDAQALRAYERYLQLAPAAPDKAEIRRSMAELRSRAKLGSGEK